MKCNKCNKEMDIDSQDFCEEYGITWCLNCCGEDYGENVKKGVWHHLSMPVYGK